MSKKRSITLLKFTFICTALARSITPFLFKILIAFCVVSCASVPPAAVRDESRGAGRIPNTYRVIPGDTLFSIAWRYGLKYEELAKFNHISPPYLIKPSQLIRLDIGSGKYNSSVSKPAKTTSSPIKSRNIASGKVSASKNNKTPVGKYSGSVTAATQGVVWYWPSKGGVIARFQSNNGLNKGVDIGGILGEPVLAAASGRVVYAGSGLRGYGKLLIIKHSETFLSAYAHNNQLLVKEGDLVKAGQRIADMGSSGADRVKLHFEIRREGTPVDPLVYLPKK